MLHKSFVPDTLQDHFAVRGIIQAIGMKERLIKL